MRMRGSGCFPFTSLSSFSRASYPNFCPPASVICIEYSLALENPQEAASFAGYAFLTSVFETNDDYTSTLSGYTCSWHTLPNQSGYKLFRHTLSEQNSRTLSRRSAVRVISCASTSTCRAAGNTLSARVNAQQVSCYS